MASPFESFFILFQTDAKKARGEVEDLKGEALATAEALDRVGKIDTRGIKALADGTEDAARQAQRLDQNLDNANDPARRLKNELKDADRTAGSLGASFLKWAGPLAAAAGALVSVSTVSAAIVGRFREINELTEKANRSGINPEGYLALEGVFEDLGGDAEKFNISIRKLGDGINKAFSGQKAPAEALAALGVNAADATGALRDTEDVILDIAAATEKMGQAATVDALRKLGVVDPAMIELITKGRTELGKLIAAERAKGLIDNQTAANVRTLKLAMDDLKDVWTATVTTLLGSVTPALQKVVEWLTKAAMWVKDNKTLVQGFAIGLVAALGIVTAFVWGAYIPAWVAAAAAVLAATWPIVAIIAIILAAAAAFALLYEDVQAFLNGQPSLLGELVNKYEWVRKAVELIGKAFHAMGGIAAATWEAVKSGAMTVAEAVSWVFQQIWRVAGPILGLIVDAFQLVGDIQATIWGLVWAAVSENFGKIMPYVEPIFAWLGKAARFVGEVFGIVARGIWDTWGSMFDAFVERLTQIIAWVRTLMGLVEGARSKLDSLRPGARGAPAEGVLAGRGMLAASRDNPMAAQTSGAVGARSSSRTSNVKIDKVEVQTQATDADGIAKAVGGSLQSEMRRTTAQVDDGVER